MPAWWPQFRAAFVAFHLVAVILSAVPAPEGGMIRSAWKDPSVQIELQAWNQRLSFLHLDDEAFEQSLWDFASAYMEAREQILLPFRPYYAAAGTRQSWRMFVAAQRFPSHLYIEVLEGSTWRLVYEQDTPGATWMKEVLEHDRMRSATFRYSWRAYAAGYKKLGAWLADVAAQDFPAASALRTRWYRQRTPSPKEVLAGTIPAGTFHSPQVYDLKAIREQWAEQ